MRPCEEGAVYICPSTYHVPCFSAQLPLCYSVTNSLRGRECRLWTCGLPFSICPQSQGPDTQLVVSVACLILSLRWRLEVYYETKLCCALQRCCRLDMHLVEGGRNFAVHEIWAQFLSISQIRPTRSASFSNSYVVP